MSPGGPPYWAPLVKGRCAVFKLQELDAVALGEAIPRIRPRDYRKLDGAIWGMESKNPADK